MGVNCSRRSQRQRGRGEIGSGGPPGSGAEQEQPAATDGARHDPLQLDWERSQQAALERLRKEFNGRPDLFLISQMIMSVYFFKNFDRDKLQAQSLKEEKERDLNRILRKDHKSAIYLGSPYEQMGAVMQYERSDSSGPTLGHDLEYLILHDNVSVRSKFDPEDGNDSATYKFIMTPSRNPGYARLQQYGDTLPGPTSRPRLRGGRWTEPGPAAAAAEDESRSVRPAPVSPRDRPVLPNEPRLEGSVRRSESEVVSWESGQPVERVDTDPGRRAEPAADRSSDPANDRSRGAAVDSADRDRPSRRSRAAPDQSCEHRGEHAADGAGHPPGLPASVRTDSTDSPPDSEQQFSSKETQQLPKSAEGRQRKRGLTALTGGDRNGTPAPELSLPRKSQTSFTTDNADVEGETEKKVGQDMGDQGSDVAPGRWMPGSSACPTHNPCAVPCTPVGPFPLLAYPHGFTADDSGKLPGLTGQFLHPMYAPSTGGLQPRYHVAGASHPFSYPVHPEMSNPIVYQYSLVPGTRPTPGVQAPTPFPGHFGYAPLQGWQRPPETNYKSPMGQHPTTNSAEKTSRTAGLTEPEIARKQRKRSQEQQVGADPRRKRSLNDLLRLEGTSVCSEDSRGSFVKLVDSTTDEDADEPGHLPHHCFRRFRLRVDLDDDDQDHWTKPRYEIHRYLSSEIFVNQFADNFGKLARLMARDVWLQQASTNFLRGSTIFCREQLPDGLRTTALITPTLVASSWPEAALAWGLRERPRLLDKERRMQYQWPPNRLVQELRQEGFCNLVPQGCFVREQLRAARHFSPQAMAVEWEVCFQHADMRLITSLEAVHIHCWAVVKLFFTHFLSEFRCLQERHIRHLMFWQFERNIRDWRLEALGGQLVELLRSLERGVRERQLAHYFVPDRNLLESDAPDSLLKVQECIQRAMENPVANVMIALSRLRVRNDAFPELSWTLLFHYLTMKHGDLLQEVSPGLRAVTQEESELSTENENGVEDQMFIPTKEELREQDRQRQQRRREAAEKAEAERRRRQQDRHRPLPAFADTSVKIYWLNGRDSRLRAQLVLDLFVRHFSAMATRLLYYGAVESALTYVDHALNLCQLLEENAGSEEADEGRRQLRALYARAAELPPSPSPERQTSTELLGLGGTTDAGGAHNWTLGPATGRAARRDYNRQDVSGGGESAAHDTDGFVGGEWQQLAASDPAQQPKEVTSSA